MNDADRLDQEWLDAVERDDARDDRVEAALDAWLREQDEEERVA